METNEEYTARNSASETRTDGQTRGEQERPWWFKHPDPVAKFTGWVAVFTLLLFIATVASVLVLYTTDLTLKETLKANKEASRAFVFFRDLNTEQTVENDQTTRWTFLANVENNGGTQTKGALVSVGCDNKSITAIYNGVTKPMTPRVIGPKQVVSVGGCAWPSVEIAKAWQSQIKTNVGGVVVYDDIFGGSHITKFCREIVFSGTPVRRGPRWNMQQPRA